MTTELADPVDPIPAPGTAAGMAVADAVRAAERLLTARLGAQVRLADPEDLGGSGRSTVLRVRVARTPFTLPRTLVVKHSPVRASEGRADLFAQEAASCQLFTALRRENRPGPELIACDPGQRLLVLEDLGRSGTVATLLFSTDPSAASRAERALLSWAHALGRLHATTRDREPDFAALLRRLGTPQVTDPVAEDGRAAVAGLPALLEAELGLSVRFEAAAEARRAAELLTGRPYRAFSPSDLGPDNAVVGHTVRFIDFEGGGFRTALFDVAQLRAPLPSSLASLAFPPGMTEAMVSAWHAEVLDAWPEFADRSLLARQLLDAQLLWTWLCTWWLLPMPRPRTLAAPVEPADGDPAATFDRGGVLVDRWERLATEAAYLGSAEIAGHASAVAEGLRRRFGLHGEALPRYPAFR
jgi:Ser/Thr protein kinase RdoA (MazF antagonist)